MTLKNADVPNLRNIRSALGDSASKPAFLGVDGERIPIPRSLHKILTRIVSELATGQTVSVIPVHQELTTQKAADLLGVSRQFLVRLLDEKKIHFHRSGTHRRIYLRDLLAYKRRRDAKRTAALDAVAGKVEHAGLAERVYIPADKA
jgi:excisionase family DNA binding protein